MSVSIVKDSLEYFDRNNDKYESIKKRMRYIKRVTQTDADLDNIKLAFYDKNKELLFISRVEFLAKYYNKIKIWVWGWSIPLLSKSVTNIIRKVLIYGTDIYADTAAKVALKNELITSRFRIVDDTQLDIHNAIASYLTKIPFIFRWRDMNFPENYLSYVEIKDKPEKHTNVTVFLYILDPPDV